MSTGLAEALHKQRSRQRGSYTKAIIACLAGAGFLFRRRKNCGSRAREGRKGEVKKVNRRLLRRLRLPKTNKQTNKQQQARQNHCPSKWESDKPLGFQGLRKVSVTRHSTWKGYGIQGNTFCLISGDLEVDQKGASASRERIEEDETAFSESYQSIA